MSNNPIQFCHIDLKPNDLRQRKELPLRLGTRRVVYGPRIRPRIEIQDEHAEIELKQHGGDILAALRLSDGSGEGTRFVTAGDDHMIVIWNVQGEVQLVLSAHTDRIGGLWELTGSRLVSWAKDNWLLVWNTRTGRTISSIQAKLWSPERLFVAASGDFFCLTELWKARLVSIDGTPLAVLRWQHAPVTGVRRLSRARWITQSKQNTKLWSRRGTLQRRLLSPFSLDDGYFDLPDGELLIVDDHHYLKLFDRQGVRTAIREADVDMAGDLRRFLRSRKSAREAFSARPTFQYFEHRSSPVSEPTLPKDEWKKLGLPEENLAGSHTFWDFFNRPDFKRIRTWRREEIQAALDARERVEAALDSHRADGSKARTVRLIACAVFCAAILGLFQFTDNVKIAFVVFTAFASMCLAVWMHIKAHVMLAARKALAALPQETDRLVWEIKAERRRILASVPFVDSPRIHTGSEVRRQIEQTIMGQLRETALRECGLLSSALITADKSPFVMRDWALARLGDRAEENSDISPHTLSSFWWTSEGVLVVAVQSIQYILLSREKVDVFSIDYDFITGRAYNKAARAFSYSEVVSITKRDVSRPVSLAGVSANIDATEMAFELTNGERISLTELHEESASAFRSVVRTKTAASHAEQRRNLQAELASWDRDLYHSDEERRIELESLRAQLAALDTPTVSAVRPHAMRRRVDEMIAYIRTQILAQQVAPSSRGKDKPGEHPEA